MNRHVNAIAGRLSLRPPQRHSLEILDRISEIVSLSKQADTASALAIIRSEYPSVTDFERDFPSLCFALATGVGKTRLMGAFISYLHLAHGINNFFVLAPNLTIYNKLIADFTPNTAKYVFKGIAEFATHAPTIITGDNYEQGGAIRPDSVGLQPGLFGGQVHINIFNISKINSEVRGGKSPRIKRLSEIIGKSYFDYLAKLPDLVLLMDESHRYRASAGIRAINDLKPILGLELTATPLVETAKGPINFKNVIYNYSLGKAMADGFVKEPAVVTRKNFNPAGMTPEAIERMKLEDGLRLHESVKVELETYARQTGNPIVKPFLLVIARDTTHAGQLMNLIQSDSFFDGRYQAKVIQVDSSKTGAEEDEMVERLLKVEHTEEPTEIVIHVNMLKEGWDVTNLYTIVPLRAANARILIEQSIGRGLRLPYGKRTGITTVDRLNIVAHDKFQEIVDEANRPDSLIRMQTLEIDPNETRVRPVTIVSQSQLASQLGIQPQQASANTQPVPTAPAPIFQTAAEQQVAQLAYNTIRTLETETQQVPGLVYLQKPEVQARIVKEVASQYHVGQLALDGVTPTVNIAQVVQTTTNLVVQQTIDIPRIVVMPKGEVRSGYHPFTLDLSALNYPPVDDELWIKHLRTDRTEILSLGAHTSASERLEDIVVSGLIDFDDVAYDQHADLLYAFAAQTVNHFSRYLSEQDVRKVLTVYQRPITSLIHTQMQQHYWEDVTSYEVVVTRGFTELRPSAYSAHVGETILNYRHSPTDRSNMARYLFGNFQRCLYPAQKFHSEAERILAVILERESLKWFKPARGQFQIYYKSGVDQREYQPDFVAETADAIYMLEPKAQNEMNDPDVVAKRDAAVEWCRHATQYTATYGGKPWLYALIPHDEIVEQMTLAWLVKRFGVRA